MENKAQYLGIFIMVLVSSMLLVGMTTVADNLGHIFESFSANNRLADAEFSTDTAIDIDALEKRFNAIIEQSSVADYESQPGQTLRIFSENSRLNLPAVMEGNDLTGNDILIDPQFSAANDLNVGDSLMIRGKNSPDGARMSLNTS